MLRFLVILLLIPCFCFGQNLVPNPSFEDYSICPSASAQLNRAIGWTDFAVSPDYYHECSPTVSVPNNQAGYQTPYDGLAYIGLTVQGAGREYAGIKLTDTLAIGTKYYVSMRIARAYKFLFTGCGIDKLGAKLSTVDFTQANPAPTNNSSHLSASSIISDTLNWTTLFGNVTADSLYAYMILGNFYDDSNTDTVGCNDQGYYYIDAVCVSVDSVTCANFVGVKEQPKHHSLNVYPNPTTGTFTVQGTAAAIQVYGLFGHLLLRSNKREIDMSNYPSGIYIIRTGEAVRKLVLR